MLMHLKHGYIGKIWLLQAVKFDFTADPIRRSNKVTMLAKDSYIIMMLG